MNKSGLWFIDGTAMCNHTSCLHVTKCMSCHKAIVVINRMVHCFYEYTKNVLKQKKKLETHFVKTFLKRAIFHYYTYHVVYVYVIDHPYI